MHKMSEKAYPFAISCKNLNSETGHMLMDCSVFRLHWAGGQSLKRRLFSRCLLSSFLDNTVV